MHGSKGSTETSERAYPEVLTMAKFRAKVAMTLLTKEIVIEAEGFTQAEEVFRNLSTDDLFTMTDSLQIAVTGQVVRVTDGQATSFGPKPRALRAKRG